VNEQDEVRFKTPIPRSVTEAIKEYTEVVSWKMTPHERRAFRAGVLWTTAYLNERLSEPFLSQLSEKLWES